jgi:hypothetical protein
MIYGHAFVQYFCSECNALLTETDETAIITDINVVFVHPFPNIIAVMFGITINEVISSSIIMTNCGYKVNMTVRLTYRVAAFLSQTGNSFPTAEVTIFIVLIKLVLR